MEHERYLDLLGTGVYCPHRQIGILLTGFPGAGKTTIAHELMQKYGFMNVGDDIVTYDRAKKTMSWGCPALGPFSLEIRPEPKNGETLDDLTRNAIKIPVTQENIMHAASLARIVKLTRRHYPKLHFDAGYLALQTFDHIKTLGIPYTEISIQENDIEGTVRKILKEL